ncbi:hypothetical protein AB395_00003239 [Sinorhizobium fredii CCBAU 45436]|nr:hypothetical protein SF83666_c30980 [Sinorhizobium fredii CCBAU 83666]AWI58881.1 hypothetical protein AB395_00003239 [Sinorhizobium fredii CCBAU 45436]AWM26588.1 hypothetical protein AOX55_00003350 [Sinorhizobium fredii CCBAU 25509]
METPEPCMRSMRETMNRSPQRLRFGFVCHGLEGITQPHFRQ